MVKVLVYRGWGNQSSSTLGVFGHIVGTDYSYEITGQDPNFTNYSNAFSQAGSGFVFRGTDTTGFDDGLVYSDGAGSAVILNDENGNVIEEPAEFSEFGSQSVFLASTSSVSATFPPKSLMITDGAGAPKVLLPVPVEYYTIVGNQLYARATDGDLYRLDQAGNSTRIYDDTGAGSIDIDFMVEFNGALLIRGDVSLQNDFYRVDPVTQAITELNIAENSGGDSIYYWKNAFGDTKFFFWAATAAAGTDFELYVSDGTSAGTQFVRDIRPGSISSYVGNNTDPNMVGDKLFFVADDGSANDDELWVSDGTSAGTFALSGAGTPVGDLAFSDMKSIALGNKLLFSARPDGGYSEIYVTDGTVAGTSVLLQINTGNQHTDPVFHLADDGNVYFTIANGPNEDGVWVTDGTAAGTRLVSDPSTLNGFNVPVMLSMIDIDLDKIPTQSIFGTNNDDTLTGTLINETISGYAGDDIINGGAGEDWLYGGEGDDRLEGDDNLDRLIGGNGDDTLVGGAGVDAYYGEAGRDSIVIDRLDWGVDFAYDFNSSEDTLVFEAFAGGPTSSLQLGRAHNAPQNYTVFYWGSQQVFLFGNEVQADQVQVAKSGSAGTDVMIGSNGGDRFTAGYSASGGEELDQLWGYGGNDWLDGQDGRDYIIGGTGNDVIIGGDGNDFAYGGTGTDRFVFGNDWGADVLYDFSAAEGDRLEFDSVAGLTSASQLGRVYDAPQNITIFYWTDDQVFVNGNVSTASVDVIA